jgi:hypothetical protein
VDAMRTIDSPSHSRRPPRTMRTIAANTEAMLCTQTAAPLSGIRQGAQAPSSDILEPFGSYGCVHTPRGAACIPARQGESACVRTCLSWNVVRGLALLMTLYTRTECQVHGGSSSTASGLRQVSPCSHCWTCRHPSALLRRCSAPTTERTWCFGLCLSPPPGPNYGVHRHALDVFSSFLPSSSFIGIREPQDPQRQHWRDEDRRG